MRRVVIGLLAALALLLLLGRWTAGLYADYLWYAALDAADVWRARVGTTLILDVASFALASLFAFANLYAVRHSVVSLVLPRRMANIEIGEEVSGRYLLLAVSVLSICVGIALMLPEERWMDALLAVRGQPFHETDPYFSADLGFFVYWLPFETALHVWMILLLTVVTALVVGLYALTPSLRWERGHLYVSTYVRRHFTMLGGVLLLILAWSYRLGMYRLFWADAAQGGQLAAVEHEVLVVSMLLIAIATLCAAVVVGWAGWTGQMRLAFLAVSVVLLISIIGRTVAPLVARRSVDPNAAASDQRKYVASRLSYTRRAYAVDRMRLDSLGSGFAHASDVAARTPIWDGATLAQAAQRMRRIRIAGDGPAWQVGDGGLTALLVERASDGGTAPREPWAVTRFDPLSVDERGLPIRLGATPGSSEELLLEEPAVFDSAPGYSIVSDSVRRSAGVEMTTLRSRLAHAWALQNFRLLFGDLPGEEPAIVRRRGVRERVAALAPFFVQGSEIVPLVAGDSLYWVLELYAAAETYPLSTRLTLLGAERGYLHHAATALVYAASGRVRIVLTRDPDPVTLSWAGTFPALFMDAAHLPAPVRAVLPPVTDAARAQALAFSLAGFRGESLEVRHFATLDGADSAASREPLHVALDHDHIAVTWPLLDAQERVRGLVVANGGPDRVTHWLPLSSDATRWGTVLDRFRSADTSVHETGLVRAQLRVLPVEGRPFYFQSVFQWRPGGSPRLLHVATLAQDSVRFAPTLARAVGLATAPPPPTARADLTTRADTLYRAMRQALSRGDWAAFGRAFDALGEVLQRRSP